jgi:hypothetical protein
MKILLTALLATASMTAQIEMSAQKLAGLWTSNGVCIRSSDQGKRI